jgi:hypothetical protein
VDSQELDGIALVVNRVFQAGASDVRLPEDGDVWCADLTVRNRLARPVHVDRYLRLNWPNDALIGVDEAGASSAPYQFGKAPAFIGTIDAGKEARGYSCWSLARGHRLTRLLWTSPNGNVMALLVG